MTRLLPTFCSFAALAAGLCFAFTLSTSLQAQSDTWTGNTSATWQDDSNWLNGSFPGNTTIDAGNTDTATFDRASANTIIDLGGNITLQNFIFTGANVSSYTIGDSADDNIIFSNQAAGSANVQLANSISPNTTITFDAGIFLGADASGSDIQFDLDATAANVSLILNGNLDTLPGNTTGGGNNDVVRLEFGDFGQTDDGIAIINGDISNTGGADYVHFFVAGANVTLNGQVNHTGANTDNTQRTVIRDGGSLTIGSSGRVGSGAFEIRSGNVFIADSNTNNIFQSGVTFGSTDQGQFDGDGHSTLFIGSGSDVTLSTNLNYFASGGNGEQGGTSNLANRGLITGPGTLTMDNNFTFTVRDNTLITGSDAELTILADLESNNGNRNLTKRGAGTLLLGGNNIDNGSLVVEDGKVILAVDDAFDANNRNFNIQAQESEYTTTLTAPVLDVAGANATINALNLGNTGTLRAGTKGNSNPSTGNVSGVVHTLDDSVGGGLVKFDNNINVRNGTVEFIGFDNQGGSANFQGGSIIQGNTSGARAYVERSDDFGSSGNISIIMLEGTFQDNEIIEQLSDLSRNALANGTNTNTTDAGFGDIRNGQAIINADIQLTGGNENILVEDGKDAIDLVINGAISDDSVDDVGNFRDLTYQDEGTILVNGTGTYDRTIIRNKMLIAGAGDIFGTGNGTRDNGDGDARVFIQQNNTATERIWDGAPTLDINGQELFLKENLIIGDGGNNNNLSEIGNIMIVDNGATRGVIVLAGNNATGRNDLTYNRGNNASSLLHNKMATVSADIRIDGTGSTFSVGDGQDAVDLLITGRVGSDNGFRQISKGGTGVLKLTNATNNYGLLAVSVGTVIIGDTGALGQDDVQLGNNTTSGVFVYDGTTDGTISNQFRIGDNNAAGTRVGDGDIINAGTGDLTFAGVDAFFNQSRTSVTVERTLGLGGNNTNTILGIVQDNGPSGAVAINKTGDGTWKLEGQNTYTGATTVSAGRIDVNGTPGGALDLAANTAIGGDATFGGNITFGGNNTLFVNAATSAALGTTADSNFGGGGNISVVLEGQGGDASGNIVVYEYNGTLGTNGNLQFTDFNSTATGDTTTSARGGGSAALVNDTANNRIVVNLGFASRTWNNASGNNTWDIGTSSNWVEGDSFYFDGDNVTFNDTPGSSPQTITLSGPVAPGSITIASNGSTAYTFTGGEIKLEGELLVTETPPVGGNVIAVVTHTINSAITGNGTIIKRTGDETNVNPPVLVLDGNNTYSGGTEIYEGTVRINNNDGLGTGLVTMSDGPPATNLDSVLQLRTNATNVANDFFISNLGGGKIINYDATGNNNTATLSGDIEVQETGRGNFRLETGNGDSLDITGNITGGGSIRTFANPSNGATVKLSNENNSFSGDFVVGRGIAEVASIGNDGQNSHAGAGALIVIGTDNNNGTLNYTGSGNTTNRQVMIGFRTNNNNRSGAGTIQNNGSGALVFTNSAFNRSTAQTANRTVGRTLTLAGNATSTAVNRIQGTIIDNTPTDAFNDETVAIAVTSGIWELSGDSSTNPEGYTGGTTVGGTNATLLVNNTSGSGTGFGQVDVGVGGTLGGTGSIGGNIVIGTGGTHTAATVTTAGTQTASTGLDYDADATLVWNLMDENTTDGSGFFDQFNVGGELDFNSNNTNIQIVTGTDVDFGDAFWNSNQTWQVWDLNTLGGTLAGFDPMNFTFLALDHSGSGTAPVGRFSVFEVNDSSLDGNGVYIQFTGPIPEPSTYALFGLGLAGFGWFARRRRRKQACDAVDSEK